MPDVATVNIEYNRAIKKAEQHIKNKEFEEALKDYEKAFSVKPDQEEPKNKIEKIKKLLDVRRKINETQSSYAFNKAYQSSMKLILNATYGAFANQYFVLSNSKIANAITVMGRNLINYMASSVDNYFYNYWHKDKNAHKLLGLEYIVREKKEDGLYYFLDRNFNKSDKRGYTEFNTGHKMTDILMSRRIGIDKLVKHITVENLPDYDVLWDYKIFDIINVEKLDPNPTWEREEETGYKLYTGNNPCVRYQDTDSVDRNTKIITDNCESTIEEFYNRNIINGTGGTTTNGHESVLTNEKSLNWSKENDLYYSPVKRIIRHRVSKPKWKLKTKWEKEIIITSDHSLIVFRNGIKLEVKPNEIEKNDKVLSTFTFKTFKKHNFILDGIESCEQIGEFVDEYVYDIESGDENQTFIGNDILVHNSMYLSYEPIMKSCGYMGEPIEFILHMDKVIMKKIFNKLLIKYGEKFKVDNKQDFELETISKSILFFEKKHYLKDVVWEDTVFHDTMKHFSPTGIKIVRSSTPSFVRGHKQSGGVWDFIRYIFNNADNLNIQECLKIVKELRKEFEMSDIEDISMTTSVTGYEEKVLNDTTGIEVKLASNFSLKAAALHNYLLNKNSEYKTKYDMIKDGKIKYYYCKHPLNNVFAYTRGSHPTEIVEKENVILDYEVQFDKTVLSICNDFMRALELPLINKRISVLNSLFGFKLEQKTEYKPSILTEEEEEKDNDWNVDIEEL